ncbi:MAG: hypothetical protein Fur0037_16150 [Planctomycetota bacterium]
MQTLEASPLLRFLGRLAPARIAELAGLLVVLIGAADWYIGADLALTAIY